LGAGRTACVGFTCGTGAFVENSDILNCQCAPVVSFTTPSQPITQGNTNDITFHDGTKISQEVVIQSDADLGGANSMAVTFTDFAPAVFNSNRLSSTTAQSPNWSGGMTPIPPAPGTTCSPIESANNNCVLMEQICFRDAVRIPCNIVAGTTNPLIKLTSVYTASSPPPNPGYFTASDGQNNW